MMVMVMRGFVMVMRHHMMVMPASHILGASTVGLHGAPARDPLSQDLGGGRRTTPILIIVVVKLLLLVVVGTDRATLAGLRAAAYRMLLVLGANEASVGLVVIGGRVAGLLLSGLGVHEERPTRGCRAHIHCYCGLGLLLVLHFLILQLVLLLLLLGIKQTI